MACKGPITSSPVFTWMVHSAVMVCISLWQRWWAAYTGTAWKAASLGRNYLTWKRQSKGNVLFEAAIQVHASLIRVISVKCFALLISFRQAVWLICLHYPPFFSFYSSCSVSTLCVFSSTQIKQHAVNVFKNHGLALAKNYVSTGARFCNLNVTLS